MNVAIIGSRKIEGYTAQMLLPYIPVGCSQIISGGAEGIDQIAEQLAVFLNLPIKVIKPDYPRFKKAAPFMRNLEIIRLSDLVLAFWDMKSHGTRQVIAECIKQNKSFRIIPLQSQIKNTSNS